MPAAIPTLRSARAPLTAAIVTAFATVSFHYQNGWSHTSHSLFDNQKNTEQAQMFKRSKNRKRPADFVTQSTIFELMQLRLMHHRAIRKLGVVEMQDVARRPAIVP
jgi:hypothetical protein